MRKKSPTEKNLFAVLIALTIALSARAESPAADSNNPLRVGVIQSLSGIAAENGTNVMRAIQLAADEAGPSAVQLIVEDDRTDPKQAVTAFQSLRQRGVEVIIGATWDFPTLPIIPLAREYKIPLLTVSTVAESLGLQQSGDFAFASSLSAEAESQPLAQWLKHNKIRSAAILSVSNSWGEAHKAQYLERLKEAGVKVLDQQNSASMEDNDWRSLLPRIRALKPDALLLILNRGDIEQILRRLREVGFDVPVFSANQAYDSFRLAQDRTLYSRTCFAYPIEQVEEGAFQSKFQARFGEPPRIFAAQAYDSIGLIRAAFAAAKRAGGSLRDGLERVSFDGVAGHYRFDPKTSLSSGTSSLVCVKDGRAVPEE